jgi:hypothetical protein
VFFLHAESESARLNQPYPHVSDFQLQGCDASMVLDMTQKWTNGVLDKVLRADPATTVGTMYLTVDFSANPPVIYAVTSAFGGGLDQNELVKIVDDGSASGIASVLATAGPNQCMRGVSFGPTVQTPHIDAISILPDRNVRLTVSGSSNVLYSLQGSASLAPSAWTSLVTNSGPNGTFIFDDLAATNYPARFYRAYYRP